MRYKISVIRLDCVTADQKWRREYPVVVQNSDLTSFMWKRFTFQFQAIRHMIALLFGIRTERPGMQAPVPGRAHMIKFFEGMCKMLPAVVSGRKGNIRNVQSTVAQKKGGLLHALAVDVSVDGAAVFFCKKRLEVGFVDSCICGNGRNINIFQIMLVNIAECFF